MHTACALASSLWAFANGAVFPYAGVVCSSGRDFFSGPEIGLEQGNVFAHLNHLRAAKKDCAARNKTSKTFESAGHISIQDFTSVDACVPHLYIARGVIIQKAFTQFVIWLWK